MRKLLLLGTALTALSIGTAMARDDHHRTPPTFDVAAAAAIAVNDGEVAGNSARAEGQYTFSSITDSYKGANGVSNQNQNAGANSVLQNSLALAYIQGCTCASSTDTAIGLTIAAAGNEGEVTGNSSSSSAEKTVTFDRERRHDRDPKITYTYSTVDAYVGGSYDSATGVFQVNQNSGANSLLQNSVAVAAATNLKGKTDLGIALALAGNDGEVARNSSRDSRTNADGGINGSFNHMTGIANVNQNVGANSELQNASSLGVLTFCGCATDNIALSVAAAGNDGGVYRNRSSAELGSNGVAMNDSFNHAEGMLQVNQNAGANSLLQNSASVAVIMHTTSTH
jgi:hypothetical protein